MISDMTSHEKWLKWAYNLDGINWDDEDQAREEEERIEARIDEQCRQYKARIASHNLTDL